MSFQLEIDLDLLKNQAVAEALAQFMRALGTQSKEVMCRPPIPGVQFELDMASDMPEMSATFGGMFLEKASLPKPLLQETKLAAPPSKPSVKPAKPKKTASPKKEAPVAIEDEKPRKLTLEERKHKDISKLDLKTRYRYFLEQLPERSRVFLDLVRAQGSVTIDEAMEHLDVKVGKAMGGLTGSIARWAPSYQVNMPYQTCTVNGSRVWRWMGSPLDEELALEEAAQAKPLPMSMLLDVTIELPSTSRTFLKHLEEAGSLSSREIMRIFKLKNELSLRGILEPIDRLVKERALSHLYVTEAKADGELIYRWPNR